MIERIRHQNPLQADELQAELDKLPEVRDQNGDVLAFQMLCTAYQRAETHLRRHPEIPESNVIVIPPQPRTAPWGGRVRFGG